jgi:hypothetical protein
MLMYLLTAAVTGNILLYSPGFEDLADYSRRLMQVSQGTDLTLVPDSVDDPMADSANLYFYGTPTSAYFQRFWKNKLPVRFSGDTVRLADSTTVCDDYVFSCRLRQGGGRTIEMAIARDAGAAAGMTDLFGHDFVLSRVSDGIMYERNLTCYGSFVSHGDAMVASGVVWPPQARVDIRTYCDRNIVLRYESGLLTDAEAARFCRLAQVEYRGYDSILRVYMPPTIHIYLRSSGRPSQAITCYSVAQGTIWIGAENRQALLQPTSNPVLTLAHELGRIALQPLSREYPQGMGADDWSHYAPMAVILPWVSNVLGDSAWIVPYEYRTGGIDKFLRLYRGGQRTYAWMLYEIGSKYGIQLIGDAARRVVSDSNWRHPEMTAFMDTLAGMTHDTAVAAAVSRAFPTPFEHSFYRALRWRETGMKPTLDRMFLEHTFVVESVPAGSLADSMGFRAGDSLVAIDGIPTDSKKDVCKRSLLHKEKGAEIIYSIRRSGTAVQLRSRTE